jgi:tRNA pseudouridine38-40 synthase
VGRGRQPPQGRRDQRGADRRAAVPLTLRALKLTLAYDGTRYAGWQVQPGRQTVQGMVEGALRQILREPVAVVGSGRTDAGVHALAQVAHVRTTAAVPADRILRALAGLLPHDIAVLRVEDVHPSFHAQHDVVSKRYRYRIAASPVVSPFDRRYVWQVYWRLRVATMRREVQALRGRHDFRAFQKSGRPVKDTRRRIFDARLIARRGGGLAIEVEADGFLYGMMRAIVGTVVAVGSGKLPPGTVARALKTGDRSLCGQAAPARGLFLVSVTYPRIR